MRLTVSPGGRNEPIDRAPTILHINSGVGFAVSNAVVGADYTVPAGRRAILDYINVVFRLDSTLERTRFVTLRLRFTPSGGASLDTPLAAFNQNAGPGQYHFVVDGPIHMLAGDRYLIDTVIGAPTPSGSLNSMFHGVEYDE